MNHLAEYIFNRLEKDADDVVVSYEEKIQAQVKFSNSKISTSQRWSTKGYGVLAAFGKKVLATTIDPQKESADLVLTRLKKISTTVGDNNEYMGIAKGPFKYKNIETYDKSVEDADMSDIVSSAIVEAKSNGAKRTAGVFESTISKSRLITTGGVDQEDKSSNVYFSIRSIAEDGSGHNVSTSRILKSLKHIEAARDSAVIALKSRNPKSVPEGKYDIFFEHLPAANLIDSIAQSASIFSVESGLSCLAGKLGKKIASSNFNLYDDATINFGIGSRKFDDEGVPAKATKIIENGKLESYLHNTSSAKRYKTKTTANAGIISPHPLNPIVEKGNLNKDELVEKIGNGLLVTNVWYTRFQNQVTGDFSTIPRDGIFLVKNGRVKGPVKGLRISDNLLGMLSRTSSFSSDQRPIMSWEIESPITCPQWLVKKVNVSRSVE